MTRYALTPVAQADFRAIREYLFHEAGPRVARDVAVEIVDAFRRIAAAPGIGHVRSDVRRADLRFWTIFSYVIVYVTGTKPLTIVSILHGKRDIPAVLRGRGLG